EKEPLEHWTPVHVHLATMDVPGRVAIANAGRIAPGQSELAQIVLERPIGALRGDRFVIRDQSARRTMGGGIVLDPFAPPRRHSAAARNAGIAMFEHGAAEDVLRELINVSAGGVDLARFACAFNLTPQRATEVQKAADAVVLGKSRPIGVSRAWHDALEAKV